MIVEMTTNRKIFILTKMKEIRMELKRLDNVLFNLMIFGITANVVALAVHYIAQNRNFQLCFYVIFIPLMVVGACYSFFILWKEHTAEREFYKLSDELFDEVF